MGFTKEISFTVFLLLPWIVILTCYVMVLFRDTVDLGFDLRSRISKAENQSRLEIDLLKSEIREELEEVRSELRNYIDRILEKEDVLDRDKFEVVDKLSLQGVRLRRVEDGEEFIYTVSDWQGGKWLSRVNKSRSFVIDLDEYEVGKTITR